MKFDGRRWKIPTSFAGRRAGGLRAFVKVTFFLFILFMECQPSWLRKSPFDLACGPNQRIDDLGI